MHKTVHLITTNNSIEHTYTHTQKQNVNVPQVTQSSVFMLRNFDLDIIINLQNCIKKFP